MSAEKMKKIDYLTAIDNLSLTHWLMEVLSLG